MEQPLAEMEIGVPPHPDLAEAARVWARIGALSFGGPAGQIAMMHKVVVEEKRWISEDRFLHALNYCMLLPGPEAQQLATYIGWVLHGVRGGLLAGLLFILPGFVVILALSMLYASFQDATWLVSLFFGLKAAVLVIVIEAVIKVGRRALKGRAHYLIAAFAFLSLFLLNIPFPIVIVIAALVGFLTNRYGNRSGRAAAADVAPDNTATGRRLAVAAPSPWKIAATFLCWLLIWQIPLLLIAGLPGRETNVFSEIFTFFSRMAIVTFGGAYAVLAYVAQIAVEHYGWLKPGEMLDGLALAETTPGPLVLVLCFVGFLAGFRNLVGFDPLLGGLLGAVLAAWATFAPSFMWIFVGAPFIERLRGNAALASALSAITAAVVGVILNLAIWFGLHVLFARVDRVSLHLADIAPLSLPWPDWMTLDPLSAAIVILSAVLIFRFRWGVPATLLVAAMIGFVVRMLHLA